MSEMVERAARALVLSKRNSPAGYPPGWLQRHVDENWHRFEDDARAVIAAIREPTEVMSNAVSKQPGQLSYVGVWQTMIDEALK